MIRVETRHVVGDLDLRIDFRSDDPVLALFGPSGAGKTTLLRIVAGLLRPATAEVDVAGRILTSTRTGTFVPPERRAIGYVAQDVLLFPHLDVAANLAFGARRARGNGTRISRERVLEVLEIGPLLGRSVKNLSGGEQRRIALGRALLSGPRLLLLDEPLAGLDLALRRKIMAMLGRVLTEFDIPAILVSHSRIEVLALAPGIVVLDRGRQVQSGRTAEVLNAAAVLPLTGAAGPENLLDGRVVGSDPAGGVTTLELAPGQHLVIPLAEAAVGDRVRITVRPEDVIVANQRPAGLSVRSILAGRVSACREIGAGLYVEVDIGSPLFARITPAARTELGLAPGTDVFVLVKAHAVERID